MDVKGIIAEMVEKSRKAQKEFENYTQEQVDEVVKAIGRVVFDNAEELAKMAVEETGMGVYEHKVKKNLGKSRIIWNDLKTKKSVGIIEEDKATGIMKVAKPMGVVGAVTPCTNAIVTPMCNAMFALKGRNSIIISPHPRAKKCAVYTVNLFNEKLRELGAPENLIQTIEEPSLELTTELMRSADVVVATGGMGMVKSAYSSGKPSYGVGAGNVQCIVDRDANIEEVVPKIIEGRTFDNGIICSGEQMAIVPEENFEAIVKEFVKNKAYFVHDEEEKNKLRKVMFDDNGVISRKIVGQSVQTIARLANIDMPEDTVVILVEVNGRGNEDVLCKEKMCPVLGINRFKTFEEAVDIAQANLNYEGKGHSTSLHSNNLDHIKYAGNNLTVSRLVINQISSTMGGGSFFNGLAPTTTLGCGSWGNNSISENFTYKHLINVSRIAMIIEGAEQPSDEEIWG